MAQLETKFIEDLAVTTAKIDALAVTTAKLDNNSVSTAKIIDGNVSTVKIQDDAVTADKIISSALGTHISGGSGVTIDVDLAAAFAWTALHTHNTVLPQSSVVPSAPQDFTTKAYVDGIAQGLDTKASCRLSSTAGDGNIDIGVGGNVTLDGIGTADLDRVLLMFQSAPAENGIYVVNAAGAWSRSVDADTSAKVTANMYCFVSEGVTQADNGYTLVTDDVIVLDSTALTFTAFNGSASIVGGDGLDKTGNVLSVNVDDSTIEINADTLRVKDLGITGAKLALLAVDTAQLADDAVTAAKMNADVAGDGLSQDGSGAMQVNAGDGIDILGDAVTVDVTDIIDTAAGLTEDGANNIQVKLDPAGGLGFDGGAAGIEIKPDITTGGDVAPLSVLAAGAGIDVTTLDGDHLTIDWVPTEYTRDATPAEAADVMDLTAHLKGIENQLATIEQVKPDIHTITGGEDAAGFFTLTVTPINAASVRIFPTGGPAQISKQAPSLGAETPDFDVLNGNELHFNNNGAATGLSGLLSTGDTVNVVLQQ